MLSSYLCFLHFTNSHQGEFDVFLYNHAVDVAAGVDQQTPPRSKIILEPPQERKKRRLFSVHNTYTQLCDDKGNVLARSQNLGDHRLPCTNEDYLDAVDDEAYRTLSLPEKTANGWQDKPYRMLTFPLTRGSKRTFVLQLAAPLVLLERENAEILWFLLTLIPLTLLVSGFLGYLGSWRALSPVRRMSQLTAQIEMKSLKERIEVKESDPELRELGKTLNQLLERVENAVATQERFVADASHQLRTPLAILRGELQLLQAGTDHSAETREALYEASHEVTQLIRMVENLLILARMDAGLDRLPFSLIRLDEILSETTNRLRSLADKRNIRLNVELAPFANQTEATIDFEGRGDAELIRCLIENLVENAIKYSTDNATVRIRLAEEATAFVLEVEDYGRGMSAREIRGLFERFRRDPTKSLIAPGAGLGLAIAKKIADIHDGTLSAESPEGRGSKFSLRLSKST